MKDAYEVLRQKELELSRVETEVEALRMIAPLLVDDGEASDEPDPLADDSIVPLRSKLPRAANDTPRPADAHSWEDRARWP